MKSERPGEEYKEPNYELMVKPANGIKINSKKTNILLTRLIGRLPKGTTYQEITKLIGNPKVGDGIKTDAEWSIEWPDGMVATIYNWKNGPGYEGGKLVQEITDWNVGGNSTMALEWTLHLLGLTERMEAEWEQEENELTKYRMPGE